MNTLDTIVVGAGFAGLSAARRLTAAGWNVLVFEKSRGLGGRAATRRIGECPVDFGAQFFTVRGADFRRQADAWESGGLCREWSRGFHVWDGASLRETGDGHHRYCCPAGMTALAKSLAEELTIQRETLIVQISRTAEGFRLESDRGVEWFSRTVLLTAPAPQTRTLAASIAGPEPLDALDTISCVPCFSLVARRPGLRPLWRAIRADGPLAWIACDDTRRENSGEDLFVLHASADFSRQHFEDDPSNVDGLLLDAATRVTGEDFCGAEIVHHHRWRFARVENPLPGEFLLLNAEGSAVFAGDAFGEANLEAAWTSGRAAAGRLLEEFGQPLNPAAL